MAEYQYVLGVAGSTTESIAALAALDGELLGVVAGAGLNLQDVEVVQFYENLQSLLASLKWIVERKDPEWTSKPVRVLLCAEGILRDSDLKIVEECLSNTFLRGVHLDQQLEVIRERGKAALLAALWRHEGIVVKAGTGAFVYGADSKGNTFRVGGWGPQVDSDGGGFWIGRAALAATTASSDGRKHEDKDFHKAIFRALGASSTVDLVGWVGFISERDTLRLKISGLARLVCDLAEAGDRTATRILEKAAQEIFRSFETVMRQLHRPTSLPTVFEGKLLENSTILASKLSLLIQQKYPRMRIYRSPYRPVVGLLVCGLKSIAPESALHELRRSVDSWDGEEAKLLLATYKVPLLLPGSVQ